MDSLVLSAGADSGEVKWVNFRPPFSEALFNHADAQTSNTSTRLWFYYIITKIHPPFQNPGSAPVVDCLQSTVLLVEVDPRKTEDYAYAKF